MLDNAIFFPMNWTFQLTCDRIRPDDCVFNPITKSGKGKEYNVELSPLQLTMKKTTDHDHPEFVVQSVFSSSLMRQPVSRTINCGSKAEIAQVSTITM